MRALVALMLCAGCRELELPDDFVRTVIRPTGGSVVSGDGVLRLQFPAGAVREPTKVEVYRSERAPSSLGPAYRVLPDIELEQPVRVTYSHVLPTDLTYVSIGVVRFADYANQRGDWLPLPAPMIDAEESAVIANDTEISLYYALVDQPLQVPSGASSAGGSATGSGEVDAVDTGDLGGTR